MQFINNLAGQAQTFIASKEFFYYHGLVLATLWFVVVNIAILFRSISKTLHGLSFFAIDVTTTFFIVGAFLRVYPHIDQFSNWSTIKQAHIVGGGIFLFLMIIQHLGGAITLIQGKSNPAHRKFAVLVTNWGRMVAIGGMIFGKVDQQYIIGACVLAFILLVASVYKVFIAKGGKDKQVTKTSTSSSRARSPPKRD